MYFTPTGRNPILQFRTKHLVRDSPIIPVLHEFLMKSVYKCNESYHIGAMAFTLGHMATKAQNH